MIKTDRFQKPDRRVTHRRRGQEPNPETESKMRNKGPLTPEVSVFQADPRLVSWPKRSLWPPHVGPPHWPHQAS